MNSNSFGQPTGAYGQLPGLPWRFAQAEGRMPGNVPEASDGIVVSPEGLFVHHRRHTPPNLLARRHRRRARMHGGSTAVQQVFAPGAPLALEGRLGPPDPAFPTLPVLHPVPTGRFTGITFPNLWNMYPRRGRLDFQTGGPAGPGFLPRRPARHSSPFQRPPPQAPPQGAGDPQYAGHSLGGYQVLYGGYGQPWGKGDYSAKAVNPMTGKAMGYRLVSGKTSSGKPDGYVYMQWKNGDITITKSPRGKSQTFLPASTGGAAWQAITKQIGGAPASMGIVAGGLASGLLQKASFLRPGGGGVIVSYGPGPDGSADADADPSGGGMFDAMSTSSKAALGVGGLLVVGLAVALVLGGRH